MKDLKQVELARSLLFFCMVWIVTQYLRGETLRQLSEQLDDFGGVIALMLALALLALKLFAWNKGRRAAGIVRRLWLALPWVVGAGIPMVYLLFYFANVESTKFVAYVGLVTDLLVPGGILLFVYILLGHVQRKLSKLA